MNVKELEQLKEIIIITAAYYREKLSDEVVKLYARDLSDLEFSDVRAAYERYRRSAKNFRSPLPASIREFIRPSEDPRMIALDVSNRILTALHEHGYTWDWQFEGKYYPYGSFQEAFIAEIGEVGWEVVQRMGGWLRVHDEWKYSDNLGTFKAQLRDFAEATYSRARSGTLNIPPGLPNSTIGNKLLSIGQILTGAIADATGESHES